MEERFEFSDGQLPGRDIKELFWLFKVCRLFRTEARLWHSWCSLLPSWLTDEIALICCKWFESRFLWGKQKWFIFFERGYTEAGHKLCNFNNVLTLHKGLNAFLSSQICLLHFLCKIETEFLGFHKFCNYWGKLIPMITSYFYSLKHIVICYFINNLKT